MLCFYGMNKKPFFMLAYISLVLCSNVMSKERDFICDAFPSNNQLRYVYQKCLIYDMFSYNINKNTYQLSEKGKPIYENLSQIATGFFRTTKPYFQPAISDLAIQYSILIDDAVGHRDKNTGMLILSYATQNNLLKRDPLPEVFFPVDEAIEDDFCYKTSKEIFEEKIGNFFTRCLRCEDQYEPCDFSELDQIATERVISGNPKEKALLFVGFDQSEPTEGLEITCETTSYTRSLFWSLWGERPNENHNAIKCCFCQAKDFLEANPQFYEFFDYIIVGAQTIEYVTSDAWITLGNMLKKGGRIAYPNIFADYFPPFLNMLLNECCQKSKGFELYKCKNASEPIYNEIKTLASFNTEPTYGPICYANEKTLYWHKKL